jgi:hypothetical protein
LETEKVRFTFLSLRHVDRGIAFSGEPLWQLSTVISRLGCGLLQPPDRPNFFPNLWIRTAWYNSGISIVWSDLRAWAEKVCGFSRIRESILVFLRARSTRYLAEYLWDLPGDRRVGTVGYFAIRFTTKQYC